MTVREVTGDLFALDVDAVGHGVNCQGAMGAGIAAEFARRYPFMLAAYRSLCSVGALSLGQVHPHDLRGMSAGPRWIYNIASQREPGRCARYDAIEVGMRFVRFHAENNYLRTVALPQIGCGIGGLEWAHVARIIGDVCRTSDVEFQLVTLP